MAIRTKIEYHLKLLDDNIIIVNWEFDSIEEALSIYNEKKDRKVYKEYTWKLEQVEIFTTDIKLD